MLFVNEDKFCLGQCTLSLVINLLINEGLLHMGRILFNFLSGRELPSKNIIFLKIGGVSSPVCGKYVHTGRPHSRINKSVFKKIQCDVHSNKRSPEKPENKKNQYVNKSKNS